MEEFWKIMITLNMMATIVLIVAPIYYVINSIRFRMRMKRLENIETQPLGKN